MKNLKKVFYTMILSLFISFNFIFAETPHEAIYQNPSKEVTKIETLKRRDKAELNITVDKKNSEEIIGYVDGNKIIIPKEENPQMKFDDNFEIIDNREGKISKEYIINKTEEGIEIEGTKVPEFLYLTGKTGTWNWNNKKIELLKKPIHTYEYNLNYTITLTDEYEGDWIGKNDLPKGVETNFGGLYLSTSGDRNVLQEFIINKTTYYDELSRPGSTDGEGKSKFLYIRHDNKNCIIETDNYFGGRRPYRCIIKISDWKDKKNFNFTINYLTYHSGQNIGHDSGTYHYRKRYNCYFNIIYKPLTLKGESSLTVREKYPTNQFIQFNSTEFEAGKPLALENSLTDVTFNTSGKGIVTMEEGDILEIDGKQVRVGASGNLGVQTATIGDLKYSYKVEAGKLRLSLNEWGVLEPNHNLMIRVFRNKDGKQQKMVEHTLTIDSPRRVEGTNNIKIDNNYQIRNVIKFSGISLNTPIGFSLESPIPTGVVLAEQSGYGIPYLDEGDIIQIDDGRTRSVHSYTVQSKGTLPSQRIEFNNGSIDLLVVNRKVQVRLNNWKVNEPMRLNLKAIRGTNEISNHIVTLTMPKAPFNQVTTGNLDFGTVLQGARNKKAESNIRIEMQQDVSDVKFKLREEQPIMTNSQGTELKVKKIDKTVQKVRDREYNIKLRGTLDVPENQQNGGYIGSNILDIKVK